MKTGLLVGDAMTKRPIVVPKNITVRECARIMRDKKVGSILITEGEELLGILTESDIIEKITAANKNPDEVEVGEIMTTALVTINPSKDIIDAMQLMKEHEIRHMPVLDKDRLAGFLTMKDVVKIEPQLFEILLETIELREESRKLSLRSHDVGTEGFCEVCGNFSESLKRTSDRRLACPACREA